MGHFRVFGSCGCMPKLPRVMAAPPPDDVLEAFDDYAGTLMHAEELQRFLVEVQGDDDASVIEADNIIQRFSRRRIPYRGSRSDIGNSGGGLSVEEFHSYLFSADLNPPIKNQVRHDMTHPLTDYFIYTGHNSYLTGKQLNCGYSVVPIVKALERGVRVIELDLWPNSTKDDVHVLHGRNPKAPVDLITCLKSIKEYAFVSSQYPLIITLEDHLAPDLQAKVAQMVSETFGDMLYCPDTTRSEQLLLSPEDLEQRIIIATKPPKKYLKSIAEKASNVDSPSSWKAFEDLYVWCLKCKGKDDGCDEDTQAKEPSNVKPFQEHGDESDNDTSEDILDEPHDSYKSLITFRAGKPQGGLKEALKVDPTQVRCISLSDQALKKATETYGMDMIRFTKKNVLTVYPTGAQANSYNPLIGWMHGAQMVAFNMQEYGRSLWLMQGMFRSNGGCGYVKKPDFLIKSGPLCKLRNPNENLPVTKTLKVKVYMGEGWHLGTHFDLHSPPNFYTKVSIFGVPDDVTMKKTKTIEKSWTPAWGEEFMFSLTVPELALLLIEVREYDGSANDDFACQTCLPVSELRQGIRAVPLFSHSGEKLDSERLLMRFEFV